MSVGDSGASMSFRWIIQTAGEAFGRRNRPPRPGPRWPCRSRRRRSQTLPLDESIEFPAGEIAVVLDGEAEPVVGARLPRAQRLDRPRDLRSDGFDAT